MTNRRKIRSATAVAAMSVALSLTACVGSTPEGRDNAVDESEDAGVVEKAREKKDQVKEEVEKAKADPKGYAEHAADAGVRQKDQYVYGEYEWLDPGDALLVEDAETGAQYDVSVDKFRTVDLTDYDEMVADLGCYDLTASVVGKPDDNESKVLHTIEQRFFSDYVTGNSTRPYLTMLVDDGDESMPTPFFADPQSIGEDPMHEAGYTLTLPTDAKGTVDAGKATNVITPAEEIAERERKDGEDDSGAGLGGDPGVSALDEWRSQWGFGKNNDDDTVDQDDEDEAETESYPEPEGDVGHSPLSLTQTRCVVISGSVPGAEDSAGASGSRGVNAGAGDGEDTGEVTERPGDIIGWLAWWRGPVGTPEDDDVAYGGWEFPLESDDEKDDAE